MDKEESGREAELVKRLAAGDEDALESLLELSLPRLRAFVRSRLGTELRATESASDLVQSTCREILEGQDRFQHPGPGAFRQWLFLTAERKVSDRLRALHAQKRDRRQVPLSGPSEASGDRQLVDFYGRFSSPSHRIRLQDEIERVERAMDRLSEEQREVILLAHMVEMPRNQIAEKLSKTDVAIRSILHRGLARLAIELDTESQGD